jgi:hypothetical protein
MGGRRDRRGPADEVARVCAIGPAGSGQLAGPPSPGTTTSAGGVRRYTAAIGHRPQTTVTVSPWRLAAATKKTEGQM